jgi:hypothetical protein
VSDAWTRRALWVAAVAAVVAAVALCAQTFGALGEKRAELEKGIVRLRELRALRGRLADLQAAVAGFEKLASRQPADLAAILREFPVLQAGESRETRRPVCDGWVVRQREMSFRDAPADKVLEFVAAVEASAWGPGSAGDAVQAPLRPPWRLVKCVIRAAGRPGCAQAVLRLEAVEKTAGSG